MIQRLIQAATPSGEGRWPRIYARLGAWATRASGACRMCFRVAMFSLHTSPIAHLGRTRDAGGMNVYIRELSRELGRGGMYVDIFTRRVSSRYSLSFRLFRIVFASSPSPLAPPSPCRLARCIPTSAEFSRRVARFAARTGPPLRHGSQPLLAFRRRRRAAGPRLGLAACDDVPYRRAAQGAAAGAAGGC